MLLWQLMNSIALFTVFFVNGTLGRNIGYVSSLYSSVFTPPKFTFAIWAVIYLWLSAFVIIQWFEPSIAQDIGAWFSISCFLSDLWVVAFIASISHRRFFMACDCLGVVIYDEYCDMLHQNSGMATMENNKYRCGDGRDIFNLFGMVIRCFHSFILRVTINNFRALRCVRMDRCIFDINRIPSVCS